MRSVDAYFDDSLPQCYFWKRGGLVVVLILVWRLSYQYRFKSSNPHLAFRLSPWLLQLSSMGQPSGWPFFCPQFKKNKVQSWINWSSLKHDQIQLRATEVTINLKISVRLQMRYKIRAGFPIFGVVFLRHRKLSGSIPFKSKKIS